MSFLRSFTSKVMAVVPKLKFNDGNEIPIFGLGTWNSPPGEVTRAVKDAIDIGYRHIDCAHLYGNEKEVGEAVATKIKEGVVTREDLFITSKLWCTHLRPDLVEGALRVTLKNLGLDYVNLYLIHWPTAYKEGGEYYPTDGDGNLQFSDVDYVDTWPVLEELVRKGLAKSIGVSNFNRKQVERVLKIAKIKPVNNQVECHPYLNQRRLIDYCQSQGVTVTAYSPLGSPNAPWVKPGDPVLLEDPKLKQVAGKYGKSSAQVVLRYQVQRGIITIPKSVNRDRIKHNFEIFDFQLSPEDMAYIDSLDCNGRFCLLDNSYGHPHHPFENDEY